MPYRRISFEEIERRYRELIQDFRAATDAAACMDVLRRRDALHADMTMMEEGLRGSDSRLIPLATEENELLSRYNHLTSNAAVQWEGRAVKRNLMTAWTQCTPCPA